MVSVLDYEERCKLRARLAEYTIKQQIQEDCIRLQRNASFRILDPGSPAPGFEQDPALDTSLPKLTGDKPERELLQNRRVDFKVGIVGAGMTGLYTAMILESLNLRYEILEASERPGGRIYTHYFSQKDGDYYDVGAMRFPKIPIMNRTFDLFRRLGLKDDKTPNPAQETLIPYHLTGPKTPLLYNNIRNVPDGPKVDYEIFRQGISKHGMVPDKFIKLGPSAVTNPIYEVWRIRLSDPDPAKFEQAWKDLTALDVKCISVRSKLFTTLRQDPSNSGFTDTELYYVTNWCETMSGSTGSYDGSFVSSVIHSLEFDWPAFPDLIDDPVPAGATEEENVWRCVNGGAEVITRRMMRALSTRNPILYNHKVTRIAYTGLGIPLKEYIDDPHPRSIEVDTVHTLGGNVDHKSYTHVINTTTLGCLQTVDIRKAGLDYAHREAIRGLGYAQAVKLGIKFKTRWWAEGKQGITGGGQGKTDRPTRVVVYPSYALDTPEGEPGVLLACYNSAQDAARLGSLVQNASTIPQELIYSYVIADLAAMHDYNEQTLRELTLSYHVHNWYGDPLTRGAWGAFGPGQYSSLFGRIQRPAARGHLFFAGEATSIYPGWIVGSLNSAYRSVRQMLLCEYRKRRPLVEKIYLWVLLFFLQFMWGANQYEPKPETPEDIQGIEGWQVYLGIIGGEAGL